MFALSEERPRSRQEPVFSLWYGRRREKRENLTSYTEYGEHVSEALVDYRLPTILLNRNDPKPYP